MLAQTMWTNILESEMSKSLEMPPQTRVVMMSNKIKALGKLYASSQKYFPLGMLCCTFLLKEKLSQKN